MAEIFKITAVNPKAKPWQSQYGAMVTYTVMFDGRELPVEINKKQESPAPKAGDEVFGDINRTEYGDKFKSQQKPFSPSGGSRSFTPKPQDQFTMYLSYAKDLAVAMLEKGKLDEAAYGQVLDAVLAGGNTLYEGKPSGVAEAVQASDEKLIKNINEVFPDSVSLKADSEPETPWKEEVDDKQTTIDV